MDARLRLFLIYWAYILWFYKEFYDDPKDKTNEAVFCKVFIKQYTHTTELIEKI